MSRYVDADETEVLIFMTGMQACYRAVCRLGTQQLLDNPAIEAMEKLAIDEATGLVDYGSHAPEAIEAGKQALILTLKKLRFEG